MAKREKKSKHLKDFIVTGATWTALVENIDSDLYQEREIYTEAATRAVECAFGKTVAGVQIQTIDSSDIPPDFKSNKNFEATFSDLLFEELEPGCGIGTVISIVDVSKLNDRMYILSKFVLQNAGMPRLALLCENKIAKKDDEIF